MKSRRAKIILADDHQILRFGLRQLLETAGDFEIVAEACNGRELLEILDSKTCELLVLDLSMPEMDGLRALEVLREDYPQIKVVVFSMHKEREFFRQALALGVNGYVLKDDDFERFPQALKDVLAGRKYFSQELTSFIVEDYSVIQDSKLALDLLTRREREILGLIAEGHTNKEIAEQLRISHRTVQTHRSNIMEKLEIKNTAGLVRFAISHGVV